MSATATAAAKRKRRKPKPGRATLDRHDNLRHTVDFRGVYRGLTEQWLGVDADGIVPGAHRFTAPRLVR